MSVRGPMDWDDLKVGEDGTQYDTYTAAAVARGLLIDDTTWNATVSDAMAEKRSLNERIRWFAIFIANVLPNDPAKLLKDHFESLSNWPGLNEIQKMQKLLTRVEYILRSHGIRPNNRIF